MTRMPLVITAKRVFRRIVRRKIKMKMTLKWPKTRLKNVISRRR